MSNSLKMNKKKPFDIYDRAFSFAVRTVKFLNKLPKSIVIAEYSCQLIRSSGSIGSNIEEADGALTKRDFINKILNKKWYIDGDTLFLVEIWGIAHDTIDADRKKVIE